MEYYWCYKKVPDGSRGTVSASEVRGIDPVAGVQNQVAIRESTGVTLTAYRNSIVYLNGDDAADFIREPVG